MQYSANGNDGTYSFTWNPYQNFPNSLRIGLIMRINLFFNAVLTSAMHEAILKTAQLTTALIKRLNYAL
jgi:hypothetical protein